MTQTPNDALDSTSQHKYHEYDGDVYDDGDKYNDEYEEEKEEDLDIYDGNGYCKDGGDDDKDGGRASTR